MRLARAVRMRPAELADRVRQERSKVLERLRLVGVPQPSPPALSLAEWREHAAERFFAGVEDGGAATAIRSRMPAVRALVLEAAARSQAHRFDLLGYRGLDFGQPIDWRLDPLSGTRARLAHWTQIDPLDRARIGDHKVVWELNRHQWLVCSAQAYALTGDEAHAEYCVRTLEVWLRANPPGRGPNWVSSLELALRVIAWSWVLTLLRDSPALHEAFFAEMIASIHAHASHIERYLSTTYSPNTHLLGEALGLFYVGVLFPALDGAAELRATGARILIEQAERQILPDGVYFEQSTSYQRYAAEMYLHFIILAARRGIAVPVATSTRVQRCVEFLWTIHRADGSVPLIGDGDGGWLLPLVPREADDMRGLFGVAGALFDRPEYTAAAGGPVPEVAWLLGTASAHHMWESPAAAVRTPASQLFGHGGYAVMQGGTAGRSHKLVLDVGPLGCPISGAHGHADLLALTCDVFGVPCIVDPGMPTYGGDPSWREAFRSTAMHSALTVDGQSQAPTNGMFAWQERPSVELGAWSCNDAFDLVDAAHDAYARRCGGLRHRRRVLFLKPRYWVIVDELADHGTGCARRIELGFQLAPGTAVTFERPWTRVTTAQGPGLLIQVTGDLPAEPVIHEGELGASAARGWFSPGYGRVQAAPALGYRATVTLPARAVTFLVPVEPGDASVPEVFPPAHDAALLEHLLP